jgi:hypothetical protein
MNEFNSSAIDLFQLKETITKTIFNSIVFEFNNLELNFK